LVIGMVRTKHAAKKTAAKPYYEKEVTAGKKAFQQALKKGKTTADAVKAAKKAKEARSEKTRRKNEKFYEGLPF